nr:hypothetical protein [Mycolicibacterium malmesburyense]CRL75797.1 hypothetical protein CPGR_03706 [Mycolicibacterium malmesburyense]
MTVLTLESQMSVDGLTGGEITDFLLDCDDDRYRAWWPGTHLEFHVLEHGGGDHVGDTVLMDEYVGSRHLRMVGVVESVVPGERIVWRLGWGRFRFPLPIRLTLTLRTLARGVHLRHSITAGWVGPARMLDPLWRLYLSPSFAAAMDRHVRTEFPMLRDLLHRQRADAP